MGVSGFDRKEGSVFKRVCRLELHKKQEKIDADSDNVGATTVALAA